ncbi:hypothetical protein BBO99_00009107 [Phytophthora kernoviae]|uniref:Uncharacterized protein n=2 Tax=Phytophthora kernoviae TaxID=325452 RepID=A0A3R7HCZ5_9STRA|nr:hypothetical protein G195_010670 [Phytophthora kernoviae 00238/432]KAG2514584.1 hypothetical protein JM16_007836 [Phytophthora kernoviae]KAG2518244.1 hypothetical protein JM18_007759 [Phytophthora kernoviae]RLN27111.1 hypothetical protein BBI17_008084 [Phytophthora kernoviae]RLN74085.1 hypothetical protein BBO99_00009107 [Phytophthora kernoviae]
MRIQFSRLRALLYVALALGVNHVVEASTCKTLLDANSTLTTSLENWMGTDLSPIDFATTFKEIDTTLPWLSKCAANIDLKSIYTSMAASNTVKSCLATLENTDLDLSTSDGWKSACPLIESTIVPCVKAVMSDSIMDALNNAGGCCDDMLSQIKTLFGDSLDDLVERLVKLGTNTVFAHSFYFIKEDDDVSVLMNLLQIPNDQMCNAFAGTAFTATNGTSVTIGFGTKGVDTMGICLQPIDEMIQYVASWPIFSKTLDASGTSIMLSDLFTSGKSIGGDLLLAYLTTSTNLPMIGLRAMDKVITALSGSEDGSETEDATYLEDSFVEFVNGIKPDAAALSVHISNNGNCKYSDQSATEVYSASNISAKTSAAVSTTKLSALATAGVVLITSLLATALF